MLTYLHPAFPSFPQEDIAITHTISNGDSPIIPPSTSKKQYEMAGKKWSPQEDVLIVKLHNDGMTWDGVAKQLPGRSGMSCRLRYQNYLRKSGTTETRLYRLVIARSIYLLG